MQNAVKDELSSLARYYEEWWENPRDPRICVFRRLNALVRSRIPAGNGHKALELGCGKGTIVSYLAENGYQVTAVDTSRQMLRLIEQSFPDVRTIEADLRDFRPGEHYDLATLIEVAQNLTMEQLRNLLLALRGRAARLFITISTLNSVHGRWVSWRKFKAPFVYFHRVGEFERALAEAGFRVTFRRGVGAVSPITLLPGFRVCLIPAWVTELVAPVERYVTSLCHLYYVEAEDASR